MLWYCFYMVKCTLVKRTNLKGFDLIIKVYFWAVKHTKKFYNQIQNKIEEWCSVTKGTIYYRISDVHESSKVKKTIIFESA